VRLGLEKILILVKTYPTLSSSYGELVCTAGLRENGTWVRIYPVPYRRFSDIGKKYQKWQWIEADLFKNEKDHRPESFRIDFSSIRSMPAKVSNNDDRMSWLRKSVIHTNISKLIAMAKDNSLSIAAFRPCEIVRFIIEKEESPEWDKGKLLKVERLFSQGDLFFEDDFIKDFKTARKLPYRFKYLIKDEDGAESCMMIEDWEIGALYWNCLRTSESENAALNKVREKYEGEFLAKKDIYLFLGTTLRWHSVGPNPFIVIGVYYPPKGTGLQMDLFDM